MSDRPIAVDSGETAQNDNLPLSVVKYPSHYGTFIGFKHDNDSDLYFCACSMEAIRNHVKNTYEYQSKHSHSDTQPTGAVDDSFPEEFRNMVSQATINSTDDILDIAQFKTGICHKCNNVVPNRRHCHKMYGTVFSQNYGWYVKQKKSEYGFPDKSKKSTMMSKELIDNLPEDVVDLVEEDFKKDIQEKVERFTLLDQKRLRRNRTMRGLEYEAKRELRDAKHAGDITADELREQSREIDEKYGYDRVLNGSERDEFERLRDELRENQKRITEAAENEVRRAVGHHEKGSRWTSETILTQLVESRYGGEYTVERHHRPDWLDGLELDIYLVEANVGVEYQGVQHYEAIEHWGGEEALEERQERDKRKKVLCEEHGVELVEVRHNEDLSDKLVAEKLDHVIE